jgi:hypothetical protein
LISKGSRIEEVKEFPYLGVTLTRNLRYNTHIERISCKVTTSSALLKDLKKMSPKALTYVFNTKIKSLVTYGLEAMSKDLSWRDMLKLEAIKWSYYKRAFKCPKSSSNTVIREALGGKPFMEELVDRYSFDEQQLAQFREKVEESGWKFVMGNFTEGPVFTDNNWATSHNRDIMMNLTVHGYHYMLCERRCREPQEDCICRLCGERCDMRYHIINCKGRLESMWETVRVL